MNIPQLIKEAHDNAVEKGFYDCPNCKGAGVFPGMEDVDSCHVCNETGIDPNKNIGELLMLIVSELGEALEAHRKVRFAKLGEFVQFVGKVDFNILMNGFENYLPGAISYFEKYIKDTFEDEIADVFIRLFDLCGYLGIEIHNQEMTELKCSVNIGDTLLTIVDAICQQSYPIKLEGDREYSLSFLYSVFLRFVEHHNIPIEKHIEAKMAYNKTRPHKHGKQY